MADTNFEKDGYVIYRNVFSTNEIEQYREDLYKQFEMDKNNGKVKPIGDTGAYHGVGDMLSKDLLRPILFNDKILSIAKKVLDSENLVYFGDSNYQIGTGFRGWHRDNIDRDNYDGQDWQGDYTILRIGLYLQDHKNYSGGLKVKKGSHKNPSGKPVFIDNEVGDVAAWSLKTIHSGNAVRLNIMPNKDLGDFERFVPNFLKKDQQKERISIFMTFGVKSKHTDRYIQKYLLERPDTSEHVKACSRNEKDFLFVENKGIELVDVEKMRFENA